MTRSPSVLVALTLLVTLFLLWGFVRPPASAVKVEARRPDSDHNPVTTRLSDEGESGEIVYRRYCAGCHGVEGDGKGPAAPFLSPKPRDFTTNIYKFTSSPGGSLPLDEDLLRTITQGLRGTSMPSWRFLPYRERLSLISYLKTFGSWNERPERPAVPFYEDPFDLEDADEIREGIALGRTIYHQYECWQCHPAYMPADELEKLKGRPPRANLNQPEGKADAWGEVILPPDFPTTTLKSVRTLRDLYRVITAGVGGTAMPTWKGALDGRQLWGLTLYVDSIRKDSIVRKLLQKLEGGDN